MRGEGSHSLLVLCSEDKRKGGVFKVSMRIKYLQFLYKIWIVFALILGGLSSKAALPSGQNTEAIKELKSRSVGLISEAANRRLLRATELAASEDYNSAIEVLSSYLKKDLGDIERSQFLQNLGFIQAQKGDYKAARASLRKALDLKKLPYGPTLNTLFAIGQLGLATENYAEAIRDMQLFFTLVDDPKPEAYIVLATAYAQKGNKKQALELVEAAIEKSDAPAENWLLFALGLHFEQENWKRCEYLLVWLTGQYPSKGQYWKQLAGVYLNLEQNAKALATMELAYKQGYIDRSAEIINLAALRLDQGLPLQAAQLVEKEIAAKRIESSSKHWEVVADSYLAAREVDRALAAMSQAVSSGATGRVLAKQGQIYLDREEWKKAADTLAKSVSVGGISSPEQVHLGIGIAKYQLQDIAGALHHFKLAQKAKEDFKPAKQWIGFLEDEQTSAVSTNM